MRDDLSTETGHEILNRLNTLTNQEAQAEFMRCCGAKRWARGMTARRPFHSHSTLLAGAESLWSLLTAADWREAFAHHPRIGDAENLPRKFASTASWISEEQSSVIGGNEGILGELLTANAVYETKFGYRFIVCTRDKSAAELFAILQARLLNGPRTELRIAAEEQKKITRLRLEKLLAEASDRKRDITD